MVADYRSPSGSAGRVEADSVGNGLPEEEGDGEDHDGDVHGNGSCGLQRMGVSPDSIRQFATPVQCFRVPAAVFHPRVPQRRRQPAEKCRENSRARPRPVMPFQVLVQFVFPWDGGVHVIAYADAAFASALYFNSFSLALRFSAQSGSGMTDARPVAESTPETHHSHTHSQRESQRYDFCQGLPYQGAFWQEKGR